MTEKEIAQALIPLVGGRENIVSVMHCATRLRIVVSDKDKIQVKEVENLDKVKGSFFNAGQYQIIFGTGLVNRVYEAVMNELGLQPEAAVDDKPAKPVIGIVLGLMLVSNSLPSAYDVGSGTAQPLIFFGFIPVAGYQGSVLPAFATGVLAAKFEKFLRKHVPDAIDLIVTPFLTLLVGILMAMFVLGPILHMVENGVLFVVEGLLTLPMGIGGLIYGSFGQLLGIFGIHHILNFLEISMLAKDGWNYLNPIGTCGNVAQAGAVLAVAIKAHSAKTKQVAYPSCLSALLGITEPAVFGVNLRYVKPFVMSMIGGGVGGFLASLFGLRATGMSITGIPGTLLYLNEQLPLYILVNVVAFAVAFVLIWLFGFNHKMEQA